MYEKMKKFNEKLLKPKIFVTSIVVIALLLFILGSFFILRNNLIDYYPEADYQILEKEVERMIAENDFTSDYTLVIEYYNNKTGNLNFYLDFGSARIKTHISNLGQETQLVESNRLDLTKGNFVRKRL